MSSQPDELLLGVNVDHVATVRQARRTVYPDPLEAALLAQKAGADAITIHLREDRRHIQESDVWRIKENVSLRLNLELAVESEVLDIAHKVKPSDCCLVPEKRAELTTEGGLDVVANRARVEEVVASLESSGIRVSLFIDPDPRQLEAAVDLGARVVELHTGAYADAESEEQREVELKRISQAVELGIQLGLQVNGGHGLNYENINPIAAIQGVRELNIGHSIVSRALFEGFEQAVRRMKQLMNQARGLDSAVLANRS